MTKTSWCRHWSWSLPVCHFVFSFWFGPGLPGVPSSGKCLRPRLKSQAEGLAYCHGHNCVLDEWAWSSIEACAGGAAGSGRPTGVGHCYWHRCLSFNSFAIRPETKTCGLNASHEVTSCHQPFVPGETPWVSRWRRAWRLAFRFTPKTVLKNITSFYLYTFVWILIACEQIKLQINMESHLCEFWALRVFIKQ